MMEGTYYKEWSAVLDREMEFKVYGHGGVPVLALPARGGRFYDWENNGMPDAAARLLHEGKIQLFCADSIDGESLLAGNETPRRRAEMQEKYFVYLTSELAARIAELNAPERKEKPPMHVASWAFFQNFLNRNLRVLLFSCILLPVIISLAKCSFR